MQVEYSMTETNNDCGERAPLRPHEQVMLRLFRCLTDVNQEKVLRDAIDTLAARFSLDPHHRRNTPTEMEEEIQDEELHDRLHCAAPHEWPGRTLVDFDAVGDRGAWLDLHSADVAEMLFAVPSRDVSLASALARDYVAELASLTHPLPSNFMADDNAINDVELLQPEFEAFVKQWRESIVQIIERQHADLAADGPSDAPI